MSKSNKSQQCYEQQQALSSIAHKMGLHNTNLCVDANAGHKILVYPITNNLTIAGESEYLMGALAVAGSGKFMKPLKPENHDHFGFCFAFDSVGDLKLRVNALKAMTQNVGQKESELFQAAIDGRAELTGHVAALAVEQRAMFASDPKQFTLRGK